MRKALSRLELKGEELNRYQDKHLPALNSLLGVVLTDGRLTDEVLLQPGSNIVNHLLGRPFVGWVVVCPTTNAFITKDSSQTEDTKSVFMKVNVDVLTSCRFWVF